MTHVTWIVLALGFAGLWWILTGGDAASWIIGVPAITAACLLAAQLGPRRPFSVSLRALPRFAVYFVIESLRAGIDVAARALAPDPRIAPSFIIYRTSLPTGWPRALFANTVSLMPGSLSVSLSGDDLTVHALIDPMDTSGGIAACEREVARLVSFEARERTQDSASDG